MLSQPTFHVDSSLGRLTVRLTGPEKAHIETERPTIINRVPYVVNGTFHLHDGYSTWERNPATGRTERMTYDGPYAHGSGIGRWRPERGYPDWSTDAVTDAARREIARVIGLVLFDLFRLPEVRADALDAQREIAAQRWQDRGDYYRTEAERYLAKARECDAGALAIREGGELAELPYHLTAR